MDAVNRQFDPSAALPEAMALLAAASVEAQILVPKAPKPTNSRNRSFRRNPGRIQLRSMPHAPQPSLNAPPQRATFARRARDPRGRDKTAMAEALLMASSRRRYVPALRRAVTPRVAALDLIRRRAKATQLVGTLRHRFERNVLDMRDGVADTNRMAQARARFHWMPSRLVAAM